MNTASTSTFQTRAAPDQTSAAIPAARHIEAVCVAITIRRGSQRSLTTPANSPSSVNGAYWQTASTPTSTGECVSRTISHDWAIRCIHVPVFETICPAKNSR